MEYSFEETLLYIENLSVQYDDRVIIKDINLTEKNVVRPGVEATGQVIAIVGRSGRGKSTFFKALAGLVNPASGKILIKDFNSSVQDAAKNVAEGDIGFVDQKYTLFRHKTVEQSFKFALRNSPDSASEKGKTIAQYLKKWGLEDFKDKYPNELSGGQRQRTAIIEQLLSSDKFIVMDEPFSGLDVGNIEEVKKSFDLLTESSEHNTIIFSTHDIELAVELAQVIYVIGYPEIGGKLMDYGTIVAKFDLREMGIAWKSYSEKHSDLYKKIVQQMMNS
jgi:ABC-type nitrate/sulfonate/bicarbonate transport system ATPase subunit